MVHRVEVKWQMDDDAVAAVQALLDEATEADGHRPLDEHRWLDLVEGGRDGYAGLVAWKEGHDHPVGYAQVSRGPTSWALEFVVDPHHRTPGNTIGLDLVTAALTLVRDEGGGHIHLWVNKPRPEHDSIAAATGLKKGRDLYEATLKAREAEPWFDPEGFLLHEEAQPPEPTPRLAGFCWTKIHADEDPPLGEIYVIAVDPDFQGTGLGRKLVLAGLDYLWRKGLHIGMLYVDADNRPAVKLYVDMGFDVEHIDRAYVGDIPPRT